MELAAEYNENRLTINEIHHAVTALGQVFSATRLHPNHPPPLYWATVALDMVQGFIYHDALFKREASGYWPNVIHTNLVARSSMFYICQ